MKNKLLLLLLVALLSPSLSLAATLRTLEVEFAFTAPAELADQLLGYRLLKNGVQVCETTDTTTSLISCDFLTEDGTFDFSLKAYYANNTESPASPLFPFTIGTTDTINDPITDTTDPIISPTPTESQGDKLITSTWINNSSASTLAEYRMYMNDTFLCATKDATASSLSCNANLIDAPMAFSMTSVDSSGSESLKSNFLLLDPSALPEAPITADPTTPLLAVINATPASGEVPLNVAFAATDSTGDITSYAWDFGDGSTGTGSVADHSYGISGAYTATLLVTDRNGASHQVSTTISALASTVVLVPPTAVLSSSTAAGEAPLVVNFDGSSSTTPNPPMVSYSWTFGDGSQPTTGEKTSHSFTTAGTYYTTLTVVDSKGLTASIDTPIIVTSTVIPNEKPTAVISSNLPGGEAPVTITFDGSQSSDPDGTIASYNWNFGDGATGSGQQISHTYTTEGMYSVALTVTDDKGETATATSRIACNTTTLDFNIEVGEVLIDHNWVQVPFDNSFIEPIVVAGPPSSEDTDPVLVRIRNINQQGFEIRLQEWDYQDGAHAPETFSYIVMEKGTYTLDNGAKIEAGSFTASTRLSKISLQQSYDRSPVILTQVITENEADAITGRLRMVKTNSFKFLLQKQESTKTKHTNETVGYIAWEPGTGEIGNMLYEAGNTANSITHNWTDLTFQTAFPALPHFITDMQSTDGGDSAAVRSRNLSQSATQIKIEEEQSKDTEVDHTTEIVGYLAIGPATAVSEQPEDLTAGEKKFTFTWEYGDTQNVSGFRFYLNGTPLCETTNPNDREITCYAALLNETMTFTMTAVFLDGTEGEPSNTLSLDPADYPELFGIRMVTFSWDYDAAMESSISGFRIYNNAQLICETTDTSAQQISCETATQNTANNFAIVAVELSGNETSPSNEIQYNP